jgi:hypothetical protein
LSAELSRQKNLRATKKKQSVDHLLTKGSSTTVTLASASQPHALPLHLPNRSLQSCRCRDGEVLRAARRAPSAATAILPYYPLSLPLYTLLFCSAV